MKTVRQLKGILNLNTIHQTRNRIKAVKEILDPYIKRGENNEILVADEGVSILTKLQDLYESGLLLAEAAEVIRSEYSPSEENEYDTDSYATILSHAKPGSKTQLVDFLLGEIKFQRELILSLSGEATDSEQKRKKEDMWWLEWL